MSAGDTWLGVAVRLGLGLGLGVAVGLTLTATPNPNRPAVVYAARATAPPQVAAICQMPWCAPVYTALATVPVPSRVIRPVPIW